MSVYAYIAHTNTYIYILTAVIQVFAYVSHVGVNMEVPLCSISHAKTLLCIKPYIYNLQVVVDDISWDCNIMKIPKFLLVIPLSIPMMLSYVQNKHHASVILLTILQVILSAIITASVFVMCAKGW